MMKFFAGFVIAFFANVCFAAPSTYQVGVGIADVTGPAAEINTVCLSICPSSEHKRDSFFYKKTYVSER